jgi:DNA-binding winged helix-turn-helix (wHTH) protein/Tol biopolymer transport system component
MPPQSHLPRVVRFGTFEIDVPAGELRKNGLKLKLQEQPFQVLCMLLEHPGDVVTREELRSRLWPADTFVDFDHGVNAAIKRVRDALGDSPDNPRFVETLQRRGYRFIGAIDTPPNANANDLLMARPSPQTAAEAPVFAAIRANVRGQWRALGAIAAVALTMFAGAALWLRRPTRLPDRSQWVQLTKFPDSVSEPALSPDGRMLVFIRGYMFGRDVYVKMLPDGEPVQLTHDDLLKTFPAFSLDGSRVAYTTLDPQQFRWDTWVAPILGGEPRPLLRNASGLVWTGPRQVLFSEIKMGVHMGIVAAEENRLGARDVYLPTDQPAMAHRSYLSPDGEWVLLAEMDHDHFWTPCRLVPMDGSSLGRPVGPLGGGCRSAAWSHDGKWMYFSANPSLVNHIWRQRFPDGQPEQITSGPTEEEGIAMAPDGRSFVTAVAVQNTSLWIHDANGERQISLEGNGTNPRFMPNGKKLCYLIVREFPNQLAWRNPGELRIVDLESGRSEPVLSGFPVLDYDISGDGRQVVMWTTDSEGKSRLWLAPFDHSSPPVQIPNVEGGQPRFGPGGDIFFRHAEFVYRVHLDGTGLRKARPEPVLIQWDISPDGRWIVEWAQLHGNGPPAMQAFPLGGGPPIPIGGSFTFLSWSRDGRSALLAGSYLVPLTVGESLPRIPEGGFHSEQEIARLPGARRIDAWGVVPGPSADVYAFHRGTTQRNLYRIPIP